MNNPSETSKSPMESGDGSTGKRAFCDPAFELAFIQLKEESCHLTVTRSWQIKTHLSIELSDTGLVPEGTGTVFAEDT